MTTTVEVVPGRPSAWRVLGTGLAAPVAPRTLTALVHLVVDSGTALLISAPVVTFAIVTVSALPLLPLAVVLFALLLVVTRVASKVERWRLRGLPGIDLRSPHQPLEGPWHRRALTRLGTAATWKELGYHFVHLPKALVFLVLVVITWSGPLALLLLPAYVSRVPAEQASLLGWTIDTSGEAWAVAAVGAALLLATPWLTRGMSRLSIGMAAGLLGGGEAEELRERVVEVEASRAGVVDAAEAERRRIERDLHDGAQQRLVALAMSLGMAKEKLDDDPEAARALIDEAHREAKSALVELRDLARGLHPPVLSDRGLAAAVAGLASRAPVPVEVDVRLGRRPSPSVEGTAYFVISESLTNVARHSGATRAAVRVVDTGPALVVEVLDDGMGGASPERGSGLRGLRERIRGLDGDLVVSSPPGGPTTIRATLPLPAAAVTQEAPT